MEKSERKGLPSASNWARYERCHGSFQLAQEAKKLGMEAHSEPSPESEKGLRIHAWLAGEKIELNESEMQTAQFLEERAQEQVKRIFGEYKPQVKNEVRLWLNI